MGNILSKNQNIEKKSDENDYSDDNEINKLNKTCKLKKIPYYFSEQIRFNSFIPVFVAYEVRFKRTYNEKTPRYAIKPISSESKLEQIKIQKEFEIMTLLSGVPNIVPIIDSFQLPFRGQNHQFLVMKYYENTDLFEYIKNKPSMTEDEKCLIIFQILQILQSLKLRKIVHNDIKLENFLIDSILPLTIHLTDFGLSEIIDQKSTQFRGTKCFMAPEILNGEPHDYSADIWSLGVNLFLMLFNCFPFDYDERDMENANMFIACIEYYELNRPCGKVSDEAWECVSGMLVKDPSKRITVEEALKLNWFRNIEYQKEESKKIVSVYLEEAQSASKVLSGEMEE